VIRYIAKTFLIVLVLLQSGMAACGGVSPSRAAIDPPHKILFIGNSFTYYNNSLHNRLLGLARAGKKNVVASRALTLSGAKLVEHSAALPSIVRSNDWDVVILQGHSLEAIRKDEIAPFWQTVRQFDKDIREAGAETVLFMTWAYEGHPEYTETLDRNYTLIGNELGILVVPVGLAFAVANERYPEIALRIADGRHPTLAGTYLAACTFYSALFRESPVGLDYYAELDPAVGAKLQAVAWQASNDYYGDH
jgi:hypothetical protein